MRRKLDRLRSAEAGNSMLLSKSPGCNIFLLFPVTNSSAGTRRSPPSRGSILQMPSSATVSEIIGPAGNDIQTFPPTVAVFQILKEDRKDRQPCSISGAAVQSEGEARATNLAIGQLAEISTPCLLIVNGCQPNPSISIKRRRCGCSSENSHVPPASQASPWRQSIVPSRGLGRAISAIVFRSTWSSPRTARNRLWSALPRRPEIGADFQP